MKIYKIKNTINEKVYIGQTIRPIQQRFRRHINDAINCKLNTHLAKAIRKYGPEVFVVSELDSASSQQELNIKEQAWIKEYCSTKYGYNETDSELKCGGNTYKSKTPEEMKEISSKISKSKLGGLNPNARSIVRINEKTGAVDIFDSIIDCARACGIRRGKTSIVCRLNKSTRIPLNGMYSFKYCDE